MSSTALDLQEIRTNYRESSPAQLRGDVTVLLAYATKVESDLRKSEKKRQKLNSRCKLLQKSKQD